MSIERQPVIGSSNVRSVGYHPQARIMEVEFQSRAVYRYFDVGEELYKDFQKAPSKGKWVAKNLHPWEKVEKVA